MGILFQTIDTVGLRTGDASKLPLPYLHQNQCSVCPRNKADLHSPKMEPQGSNRPDIYLLCDQPTRADDRKGRLLSGDVGRIIEKGLRHNKSRFRIRKGTLVRCAAPMGAGLNTVEIECCRNFLVSDIEATKPLAIFGFGAPPLSWLIEQNRVYKWRGRKVPVRVGTHVCWYFPFTEPRFIIEDKNKGWKKSGYEEAFDFDMKKAFEFLDNHYFEPKVHLADNATDGIICITGKKPNDLSLFKSYMKKLTSGAYRLVGVDLENYPLRPYKDGVILSAAFSCVDFTVAVAVGHESSGWSRSGVQEIEEEIQSFLLGSKAIKTVHNLSHELEWFGVRFGRSFVRAGKWACTQAMAYVLDERTGNEKPGCHSLEFLSVEYFGFNLKKLTSMNAKDLRKADLDTMLLYNGMDAKYHRLLYAELKRELQTQNLFDFYQREHLRRIPTLVLTQMKGVPLNAPYIKKLNAHLTSRVEKVLDQIERLKCVREFKRRYHKTRFNPSSNPDVTLLLDEVLGFGDKLRDKETHKIQTDKGALKQVKHKFCDLLILYRVLTKMVSTYSDGYLPGSAISYVHDLWGWCLHPRLNSLIASTGRTSSDEPNSQNFPKRSEGAEKIRRQFKVARNRRTVKNPELILSIDYGQIEARIIGIASKCRFLCDAILQDFDVHQHWAEKIAYEYPSVVGGRANIKDKTAMKKFRSAVKNQWVFPAFYNAMPPSISRNIGIPLEIVESLFSSFWEDFHEVKTWQEAQMAHYKKHGYVETLTGRRRRYPLTSNQIVNMPIQGTAGDVAVDAMNRLSEKSWRYQANMYIHDDLTFWLPEKFFEARKQVIITEMLRPVYPFLREPVYDDVIVPLTVEVSRGTSLADMEEIGTFSSDKWEF